jgi:hypothetical protein
VCQSSIVDGVFRCAVVRQGVTKGGPHSLLVIQRDAAATGSGLSLLITSFFGPAGRSHQHTIPAPYPPR